MSFKLLMRNVYVGSLRIIADELCDFKYFHYPYIQLPNVPLVHLAVNLI